MKKYNIAIVFLLFFANIFAQENTVNTDTPKEDLKRVKIGNQWMYALVTEGDTLYISDLSGTSITMPRTFKNNEEKRYYYKLKRNAQKVYPYAVKAITLYKKAEEETQGMRKRKRKRYTKKMHKQLKKEFEQPLKKLTKTQGKILIAMIERELDTSFFSVIKGLRNGWTASYWNVLGRFYGYRLKKKYDPTADPMLEAVLSDFDIDLDSEE